LEIGEGVYIGSGGKKGKKGEEKGEEENGGGKGKVCFIQGLTSL